VLSANTGAALIGAGLTGEDPAYPLLGATVGTFVGWGVGAAATAGVKQAGNTLLGQTLSGRTGALMNNAWDDYGWTITSYSPWWDRAAPYVGIGFGNFSTEAFGSALQNQWFENSSTGGSGDVLQRQDGK
jgi:hypothetical protein